MGIALFGPGTSLSRGMTLSAAAGGSLFCLVWPALGWYLWARAPQVAARLLRGSASVEYASGASASLATDILAVALLAIAVDEITEALPTLTAYFINYGRRIHNLADLPWDYLAPPLIRLAIGLCMIGWNSSITTYLLGWSIKPLIGRGLDETSQ